MKQLSARGLAALVSMMAMVGCAGHDVAGDEADAAGGGGDGAVDRDGGVPPGDGSTDPPTDGPGDPPTDPIAPNLTVRLIPAAGQTGTQVVNFAIPLPAGLLTDPALVRVAQGTTDLPAYRRGLGAHADGSVRSVQIQVQVAVAGELTLAVAVGQAGGGTRAAVPVTDTLIVADGTRGPKVWALLPADWMVASGVAGALATSAQLQGSPLDAWDGVCDYATWDTDAFLVGQASRDVWLFDRTTAMYRGYAMTADLVPLTSAYREAAIYRAGITGAGATTRIGVPGAVDDLKYHYTQGMALHYLMTGDDRFREAAEGVATRAHALWSDPGYAGGDDFWTERHAGFALLAYEWAALVSDDQVATFAGWATQAVDAYLAVQDAPRAGADPNARCFAHSATAHGEDYGTTGCSPWMSAILADGLEAHARRTGGARAATVRAHLVKLGRAIAQGGRGTDGKPYYWMAPGAASEVDDYDEHWGEAAYQVAMAWHYSGRTDAGLRQAADQLVAGLRTRGEAGQLRSFNWQCRSAVQAPAYLR